MFMSYFPISSSINISLEDQIEKSFLDSVTEKPYACVILHHEDAVFDDVKHILYGGVKFVVFDLEGFDKESSFYKLYDYSKERFPEKDLWSWSGFLYDDICNKEIFNYLDVLVDGQFKDELRDPRLKWRGSSNQRVIDVKKSLKKGEVVLFCD